MSNMEKSREDLVAELDRLRDRISELKERQAASRQTVGEIKGSARKYRLMVEKAKEAFLAVRGDRIRFFNHRALELTGLSKEELITRTFVKLFHPGDRSRISARDPRKDGASYEFNSDMLRLQRKTGGTRWVELNASPIEWEEAPASLISIIDCTERIRYKESLRKSETLYQTLVEHADDAIFFETENREIVDVNRRACEMFGYSREELLQMKTSELYFQDEPSQNIYTHPALSLEAATEIDGRHRDQHRLPLECSITPFVSGRETIFMSIVRDCTERKRAEEDRVKQEKLEAILEMTGAVCHELSQPMMAIFGYTELVAMKMPKEDPLYDQIMKIGRQVDRMGQITDKLLRITRYETRNYLDGMKIVDIDKSSSD